MKSKILSRLRDESGYVSGQDLCSEFGVSRTAIWKAVSQLREEGYEIEAVQNKGYRLLASPDVVSCEEIKSRLDTQWAGSRVYYYETLDSTNICAKRLAEQGAPNGTLILADRQTAGRGRLGRSWETDVGTSVAMTVIVRPKLPPTKASMLTLVMGMAVASALNALFGLNCKIKWPNDVVVNGRKICGILTEMSAEINRINYLVIGSGINANMEDFPHELKDRAVSLRMLLGKRVNRAEIICACMKWLETYYDAFQRTEDMSGLMEEYNRMLVSLGREVCVLETGGAFQGDCLGVNREGELLVRRADGTVVPVYAGEVSVRGIYGYV